MLAEYLDVSEPIQFKTELVLLLLLRHVCAESNFTWEAFLNMVDFWIMGEFWIMGDF